MKKAFCLILLLHSVAALPAYLGASIYQLISVPEKFYHKEISTIGYMHNSDRQFLYVDKKFRDLGDSSSAISLLDRTDKGDMGNACGTNYVTVQGRWELVDGLPRMIDVHKIFNIDKNKLCWTKEQGNIYPDGFEPENAGY